MKEENHAVPEMTDRQYDQTEAAAQFYNQAYEEYDRENSLATVHADDIGISYTRDISLSHESSSTSKRRGIMGYFRRNRSTGIELASHVNIASLELDIGLAQETRGLQKWCRFLSNALCPCCWKDQHGLEDKPSNEELLSLAFASFLAFTICQVMAGFFSGSESLLADSCVMAIDAFTYGCNLIAERMKNRIDSIVDYDHSGQDPNITEEESERRRKRSKRKLKLILEVIPPIVSVLTLLIVTSIVMNASIRVLSADMEDDENDPNNYMSSDPNTTIMFIFSALNLVIDAVNVLFFVKADHAFGFHTTEEHLTHIHKGHSVDNRSSIAQSRVEGGLYSLASQRRDSEDEGENHDSNMHFKPSHVQFVIDDDNDLDVHPTREHEMDPHTLSLNHSPPQPLSSAWNDEDEFHDHDVDRMIADFEQRKLGANLNMCSAYTHIVADTLRSITIVIASLAGKYAHVTTSEIADASAAVFISGIIIILMVPLLFSLGKNCKELWNIRNEERSERHMGAEIQVHLSDSTFT